MRPARVERSIECRHVFAQWQRLPIRDRRGHYPSAAALVEDDHAVAGDTHCRASQGMESLEILALQSRQSRQHFEPRDDSGEFSVDRLHGCSRGFRGLSEQQVAFSLRVPDNQRDRGTNERNCSDQHEQHQPRAYSQRCQHRELPPQARRTLRVWAAEPATRLDYSRGSRLTARDQEPCGLKRPLFKDRATRSYEYRMSRALNRLASDAARRCFVRQFSTERAAISASDCSHAVAAKLTRETWSRWSPHADTSPSTAPPAARGSPWIVPTHAGKHRYRNDSDVGQHQGSRHYASPRQVEYAREPARFHGFAVRTAMIKKLRLHGATSLDQGQAAVLRASALCQVAAARAVTEGRLLCKPV